MSSYFTRGLNQLDIVVPEGVVHSEMAFLAELLRWNQRVNLTSITDYHEAIEKHLIDSLLLLLHRDGAKKMMDMGSGGGLPGVPLAIAVPTLAVVSIDSVGKKINFQKHIKRLLKLNNLTVLQSRLEDLKAVDLEQQGFDLVVSRAFSSLETSIKCAIPWLAVGGRLIAMKGPEGRGELILSKKIIEECGFDEPLVFSYLLPYSRAERQLLILKKR